MSYGFTPHLRAPLQKRGRGAGSLYPLIPWRVGAEESGAAKYGSMASAAPSATLSGTGSASPRPDRNSWLRGRSPGILFDCLPLPCLAILSVIRARRLTSFPELRLLAASFPELRLLAVTRPLLAQHYGAALVEANNVERVLTDIDANYGNCTLGFRDMAGSLSLVPLPSF
jgi:hypothetical protein